MAIRFGCAFIFPVASVFHRCIITDSPAFAMDPCEDREHDLAMNRAILAFVPFVIVGCDAEQEVSPSIGEAVEMVLCATSEEDRNIGLSMLVDEASLANSDDGIGDLVRQYAEQTECPVQSVPPPPPGYLLDEG